MNEKCISKSEMNLINGGIGSSQTDTMTVTFDRETGDQTVTNDGKDPAPSHYTTR